MKQYFLSSDLSYTVFKSSVLKIPQIWPIFSLQKNPLGAPKLHSSLLCRQTAQPYLIVRLCIIGVTLSAKIEERIIMYGPHMPKWAQTCEKILSQVGIELEDYEADFLPAEPRWLVTPSNVWSVFGLCAKCDIAIYRQ